MTDKTSQGAAPAPVKAQVPAAATIPSGQAGYLVRVAARAPSLHNTQPWRFKVRPDAREVLRRIFKWAAAGMGLDLRAVQRHALQRDQTLGTQHAQHLHE